MENKIDVAVCYHKESLLFESDALKPMQLGRALSELDLGMRGDDTGENISKDYKYYAEETAFYWLWKNSVAAIKGLMHYRRLLDLNGAGGRDREIVLEDITDPRALVDKLGLTCARIAELLKDNDVLLRNNCDVYGWFAGSVEEQYKAAHIPEYWDYMMEIIRDDFPDLHPAALRLAAGHFGWFNNIVVMRGVLFDRMCEFRFGVLRKLEGRVDRSRPEIALGDPSAARYPGFIGERLTMVFIKYLEERGAKTVEFPVVAIAPCGIGFGAAKTEDAAAYAKRPEAAAPLAPAFADKNAVAIMLATDNNYAPYAGVMIHSIVDNAAPNRNYDIVVAGKLNERRRAQLAAMATDNVTVRVLDMEPYLAGLDLSLFRINGHLTIETYWRFFIPRLFASYAKVLYLDADMVALRDVAELYDTEMGDNWWAAARDSCVAVLGFDPGSWENRVLLPYMKNDLKIDSVFDYFQAGVMLWNVPQCAKDKVSELCLAKLKELGLPIYHDQSVMNSVANGRHILYLSGYWNALWFWRFHGSARPCGALETAMRQADNAYILHFASHRKPWLEPTLPNADKFWRYARRTPFYEAIMFSQAAGEKREWEIRRCRRKIKQYRLLNALTLGLIKAFRRRKNLYRERLKIQERMA